MGPGSSSFSDGAGGIERIRMELASLPGVLDALDTTADPTRTRPRQAVAADSPATVVLPRIDAKAAGSKAAGSKTAAGPTAAASKAVGWPATIDLRDDLAPSSQGAP